MMMKAVVWTVLYLASSSVLCEENNWSLRGVLQDDNRCVCKATFPNWNFPVEKFKELQDLSQNCTKSLEVRKIQADLAKSRIPDFETELQNISSYIQQFESIYKEMLYYPLNLWSLRMDLKQLNSEVHKAQESSLPNNLLQRFSDELLDARDSLRNIGQYDKLNLLSIKHHLRNLKEHIQTISVYGKSKIGNCSGILRSISQPVTAQINPFGAAHHYGAWGMDSMPGSPELYWVMVLSSSKTYGNIIRTYSSYKPFLLSKPFIDYSVTSSATAANSIQGPGSVLYNGSLYYNCFKSRNMCKYDLSTKVILHRELPEAGFNNKFPYCYYDCYGSTDMDFSVDENGLWVIYTTEENFGNIVVSKLNSNNLRILETWRTQIFKKAVTNAFMACGVLYTTRYISDTEEEIFRAFDVTTNRVTSELNMRFTKYAKDIQNLHYNPGDRKLYLYNDGYMIAYNLLFY